MQDVTNNINNLGKGDEKLVTVQLTKDELIKIREATRYVMLAGHDGSILVKLYEDSRDLVSRYFPESTTDSE